MPNPPEPHHSDDSVIDESQPSDAGSIEDVVPDSVDVDARDVPAPETPEVIPLGESVDDDPAVAPDATDETSANTWFDVDSSDTLGEDQTFPTDGTTDGDFPSSKSGGAERSGVSTSFEDTDSQPSTPDLESTAQTGASSRDPRTAEWSFTDTTDDASEPIVGANDAESAADGQTAGSIGESSDETGTRPAIGTRIGNAASRLGLGKLLETSERPPHDDQEHRSAPSEPTDPNSQAGLAAGLVRAREGFRGFLDPDLELVDLLPHRRFIGIAAALAILFLLSNGPGLALITLSLVIPVLVVMTLVQRDVFEKESNLMVGAVALAGGVAGLIITGFSAWLQNDQWFSNDDIQLGAAGFGGHFADRAGSAPFVVWFINGLLVPALTVVAIAGIPIALRRWPQFRNEVMDGVILAGAAAAGFAVASNVIYWWPMISHAGPQGPVDEWTMRVVGVVMLRSMVIVWAGAMIGAGVWRSMMRHASRAHTLPAMAGILGIVLLMFGSIQLQPGSPWAEFLWTAVLAAAAYLLFQHALDQAIETDRQALGANQERVVCPQCHRVTPSGTFCSYCGASLVEAGEEPGTGSLQD